MLITVIPFVVAFYTISNKKKQENLASSATLLAVFDMFKSVKKVETSFKNKTRAMEGGSAVTFKVTVYFPLISWQYVGFIWLCPWLDIFV